MPRNGSEQKNNADTGEVAERFNAAVLKTVEDASPPRVRISASPPIVVQKALLKARLFCCKHVENTNAELAELWERSSTPSERQTAVCRLPEAMSAGAAQPVPPSFYENDKTIAQLSFPVQ